MSSKGDAARKSGRVADGRTFMYVSNMHDGNISTYTFAPDTGVLTPGEPVPSAMMVMPMAPTSDGKQLFAAVRSQPYSLFNYLIDAKTGALTWTGTSPMPDSMVYISIDRAGKWLLAVSYGGNVLSVHAIGADGRVAGESTQLIPSGGMKPHAILGDKTNKFVYVPHLETDEIRVFKFDDMIGSLTAAEIPSVRVAQGAGPRHLLISNDNRFIYLLCELDGTVLVFERDAATGNIKQIQAIGSVPPNSGLVPGKPGLPADRPGAMPIDETTVIRAADIQATPDNRFLFTTERTRSTITSFEVDTTTGKLRYVGTYPTESRPRGIAVAPQGRWLVASGQKSRSLSVYAIDAKTGVLTRKHQVPVGNGANWVQFVVTE